MNKSNNAMNDFIRGKRAATGPAALTEHEENRVVYLMESAGMPYREALELVKGYQAPEAVNGNAGSGAGTRPPQKRYMDDWIRKAAGK